MKPILSALFLALLVLSVPACGSGDGGRKPIVTGPQPPAPPLHLYQPDMAAVD